MDVNQLDNGSLRDLVVRLAVFNLFWAVSDTVVYLAFQGNLWSPLWILPTLIVPVLSAHVILKNSSKGVRFLSIWLSVTTIMKLVTFAIATPILIVMARRDGFEELCADSGDYCSVTAFTTLVQMAALGAGFSVYYTLAVRRFASIMKNNPDAYPPARGNGVYLPVNNEEEA